MQEKLLVSRLAIIAALVLFSVAALGTSTFCSETPSQIEIKKSFMKSLKFTVDGRKPKDVYGGTCLSFSPEFKQALSACPAALKEARKSFLCNGMAFVGEIGLVAFTRQMLVGTAFGSGSIFKHRNPDRAGITVGGLAMVTASSLVMIIGKKLSGSHIKKSVQMCNAYYLEEDYPQPGNETESNSSESSATEMPLAPSRRLLDDTKSSDTNATTLGGSNRVPNLGFYVGLTNDRELYPSDAPAMDFSDYTVRAGVTLGF